MQINKIKPNIIYEKPAYKSESFIDIDQLKNLEFAEESEELASMPTANYL